FDTTLDSLLFTDSVLSSSVWLDSGDSSIVHLLPNTSFALGKNYSLKVNVSGITGDTTQDGSWGFLVRKNYRLNIIPSPTDGLTCFPQIHFDPIINENYR